MKKFIQDILGSLENTPGGYSGRKLSAFAGVITAIALTFLLAPEYELHAIYAWLLFSLLCLSVITAEQIIKFRNGNNSEQSK